MKYILLFLFLVPHLSFSQERASGPSSSVFSNNLEDFALQKIDKVFNNEISNKVSGQTYLFNDWKPCYVKTNINNSMAFSVPCNYNLLMDQFEMKVEDDIYYLKKNAIVEIKHGQQVFKPNDKMETKDSRNFMELLAEGEEYDLIRIYRVKIKEVQSSTSLGLYDKKISKTDKLYFRAKNSQQLIEVPRSNKKIREILNISPAEESNLPGNLKKTVNLIMAVEMGG